VLSFGPDYRPVVSSLYEITPTTMNIFANKSPSGDFSVSGPNLTIMSIPILVPRELEWAKIATMSDLLRQGGKILDQQYYQ
jgi:hypothetical protein